MPTAQKEALVEEFRGKLSGAQGVVLADFTGMDVATVTALRADLRKRGVHYHVVKNTLLKLAAKESGARALEPYLEGPTALAFSLDSEVEAARALVEFAKKHDKPVVKAGVIGERLYTKEEVLALAALPPRDELLAQVIGTIVAPLSSFLGAVDALVGSPARLAASLEQKQAS